MPENRSLGASTPAHSAINHLTLEQELANAQMDLGSSLSGSFQFNESRAFPAAEPGLTVRNNEAKVDGATISASFYVKIQEMEVELENSEAQNKRYQVELENTKSLLQSQAEMLNNCIDTRSAIESEFERSKEATRQIQDLLSTERGSQAKLRDEISYVRKENLNLINLQEIEKFELRQRQVSQVRELEEKCRQYETQAFDSARNIENQQDEIGTLQDQLDRVKQQLDEAKSRLASVQELKTAVHEFQQQMLLGADANPHKLEEVCITIQNFTI
ncbi:hypothetical protein HDE_12932 [Halotydeus destructor]|nr:hypothetical protein HDE_12932 [Halotydeus destructor]